MTQPVNSYTIGDTNTYSITSLMQTAEIQRRGYMQYHLLNADNTGAPGLKGYAGFNLNGSLYFIADDQPALYRSNATTFADISTAPAGNYFIFVNGSGSTLKVFVAPESTAIVYDVELAGWVEQYTQNYLVGGVTVATVGSSYTLKWVVDRDVETTLSRIYTTGYDIPVYRFTGAAFSGTKSTLSFSGTTYITVHYPCMLSLDITTDSDIVSSGTQENFPTLEGSLGNSAYAVGVMLYETDDSNVNREYLPKSCYEVCVYTQGKFIYGTCAWSLTNAYNSKNVTIPLMPGSYTLHAYNCSASGKIRNTFGTNKTSEY